MRDQWSIPVPVPYFHFKIPLSLCRSVPRKPVSLWRHQWLWVSWTIHSLHPFLLEEVLTNGEIHYSNLRRLSLFPNMGQMSPLHTCPVSRRKHTSISLGLLFILMMEAIHSSEISVFFHHTVSCYVSEDSPNQNHNCEHLNSNIMNLVNEDNVIWGINQQYCLGYWAKPRRMSVRIACFRTNCEIVFCCDRYCLALWPYNKNYRSPDQFKI